MENSNLTPEQSLQLINNMIQGVKKDIKDNGFLFLLWGWLVFAASITHFILLKMQYTHAYVVWPMLMPLGGIISVVYGISRLKSKERRVKTFVDRAMIYVWIAFAITLCIVLSSGARLGFDKVYPFVLLIYGIGTFITGGIIKMKWLVVGGVICWILSVVAFYVNFEVQLILLATAIAVAYIFPGHVLRANYKKHV
jgi:hypothetical protein